MSGITPNLGPIAERLRARLEDKYRAREQALSQSRAAIRHCANAIRAAHRGEFPQAQALLDAARDALRQGKEALTDHQDVFYAGFMQDAEKEFAEAAIVLALVAGQAIPAPDELEVDAAPYLQGLGEAVGELRRHLLDTLRQGNASHGEEILEAMEEIYVVLATMDFPDAMTRGLRRTTDAARAVLERSRGDLTLALRQESLERRLLEVEQRLKPES